MCPKLTSPPPRNDPEATAGPRCGRNLRPGVPYLSLTHFNSLFQYEKFHIRDISVSDGGGVKVRDTFSMSQRAVKFRTPCRWSHSPPKAAKTITQLNQVVNGLKLGSKERESKITPVFCFSLKINSKSAAASKPLQGQKGAAHPPQVQAGPPNREWGFSPRPQ